MYSVLSSACLCVWLSACRVRACVYVSRLLSVGVQGRTATAAQRSLSSVCSQRCPVLGISRDSQRREENLHGLHHRFRGRVLSDDSLVKLYALKIWDRSRNIPRECFPGDLPRSLFSFCTIMMLVCS